MAQSDMAIKILWVSELLGLLQVDYFTFDLFLRWNQPSVLLLANALFLSQVFVLILRPGPNSQQSSAICIAGI